MVTSKRQRRTEKQEDKVEAEEEQMEGDINHWPIWEKVQHKVKQSGVRGGVGIGKRRNSGVAVPASKQEIQERYSGKENPT